jgi:hypothetical protein
MKVEVWKPASGATLRVGVIRETDVANQRMGSAFGGPLNNAGALPGLRRCFCRPQGSGSFASQGKFLRSRWNLLNIAGYEEAVRLESFLNDGVGNER